MQEDRQTQEDNETIGCSIGIMAYNEEANIAHTVRLVLEQHGPSLRIDEIIVVASGCTDRTVPIVAEIASQEPRVRLCVQEKREGKSSAINLFLKQAISRVVVLIGADVIPGDLALEYLCAPLKDPTIGMVGGRPVPINDSGTFMGHSVHLLWSLHDRMARVNPKLGEVIAFKNVISGIPTGSAVDEISIQALISQLGYQTIYQPECIVYNKGPLNIGDFLKQRRRIYAGHLQVRDQQKYEASTMKAGHIFRQLSGNSFAMGTPKRALWTAGTITLEGIARLQGYYDYLRKHEHHIWQMVESTKDLEMGKHAMRRLSNAMSVIIFRFILENVAEDLIGNHESADRDATEAVRKLLPVLKTRLRNEGKLSLTASGPGILTAVIRAEQQEAELLSKQIEEIVESTPVRIGMRGREVKVVVAHSSLTFKAEKKNVTVSSPLVQEAMVAAGVTAKGQ